MTTLVGHVLFTPLWINAANANDGLGWTVLFTPGCIRLKPKQATTLVGQVFSHHGAYSYGHHHCKPQPWLGGSLHPTVRKDVAKTGDNLGWEVLKVRLVNPRISLGVAGLTVLTVRLPVTQIHELSA